jgi:hypothetical protein
MNVVVKGTPTFLWEMHCVDIHEWVHVVECFKFRFHPMTNSKLVRWYKGIEDCQDHIYFFERCWMAKNISRTKWVHRFGHTMDMVPISWYIQEETRRKIGD